MKYTGLKLIPMPKEVIGEGEGGFSKVSLPASVHSECERICGLVGAFSALVAKIHGITLNEGEGGIELLYDASLSEGEYRLDVTESGARAYFASPEGAGYALSTLLQLIRREGEGISLPAVEITDKPDSDFRAVMVDLARQWHEFDSLLFYVDLCFLFKIKYLHLHFMDTQSYTLPSKKYPLLPTENRHYSFEEIEYLNKYAEERGIEIIPEIELPGHSQSMVTAYPELFKNTPDSDDVVDTYSLFNNTEKDNIICVGKEGVMESLSALLSEVIELFPNSEYLHIGGDEATIADWSVCRDCKRYMKEHGIDGVKALYSHFVKEITDEVLRLGKTPIVWEGFPMEGADKISRDVIVVAWESFYLLPNEIIDLGFKVINASWQPLYIIPECRAHRPDGDLIWDSKEILAWNLYNWQNWNKKTAAYLNPINVQPTSQVIGGELCVWECAFDEEVKRVKENLAALSERTWNIRRYATDAQFKEKLSEILPLADRLEP